MLLQSLAYFNPNTMHSSLFGFFSLESFPPNQMRQTMFGHVLFIYYFALNRTFALLRSGVFFPLTGKSPSEYLGNKNKCIQIAAGLSGQIDFVYIPWLQNGNNSFKRKKKISNQFLLFGKFSSDF